MKTEKNRISKTHLIALSSNWFDWYFVLTLGTEVPAVLVTEPGTGADGSPSLELMVVLWFVILGLSFDNAD